MKKLPCSHSVALTILYCLFALTPVRSQVIPTLGVSDDYGILSGDVISNSNPLLYSDGKIGSTGPVPGTLVSSDLIFSNGSGTVPQALLDLDAAIAQCTSQSGTAISGNLGGQTLSSGVYEITGNATLQNTLTLQGNSNSKFIFNITGDFSVLNGSKINLNNCLTKNIFWVVQGQSDFADNIWFYGIVLSGSSVHLNIDNHGAFALLCSGSIVFDQPAYFTNDQNIFSYQNLSVNSNFGVCVPNSNPCEFLPNGDFQNYITPGSPLSACCFWSSPSWASPDYYAAVNPPLFSVPGPNFFGFQADQAGGSAYGGAALYNGSVWREYLQSSLKSNLTNGQQYYVEYYWVFTENSRYAVNRLELAFTNGPVFQPITTTIFLTPSIPTSGALLTDAVNWTRINGCYTADGTENNLVIGNFYDNGNPNLTITLVNPGALYSDAYYFVDGVSIAPVDAHAGSAQTINCGDQAQMNATTCLSQYPGTTYQWSPANYFINPNDLNATTIGLGNNGCGPQNYVFTLTVTAPDGLCSVSDQVTITVLPNCIYTIQKTAVPSQIYSGQSASFDITVCNPTSIPQLVTVTDPSVCGGGFSNTFILQPGCSTLSAVVTCTFNTLGTFCNTATLTDPCGNTTSSTACVLVLDWCPGLIRGQGDCNVGNVVAVELDVHANIPDIKRISIDILYPGFLDPPAVLIPNTNFHYPPGFGNATINTYSIENNYTGYPMGNTGQIMTLDVTFQNAINVSPPYSLFTIDFIYANTAPFSKPPNQNDFRVFALRPGMGLAGLNHTDLYNSQNISLNTSGFWTQAFHVILNGCNDVTPLDASFTISQIPCTGQVIVTGNYVSPTAIHTWDFGDNRTTAFSGAQTFPYDYYAPISQNTGWTNVPPIPPAPPGVYTITHTVIENGVATTSTQQVVLYPPCCQQTVTIHDGDVSTMYGNFLSGTDVDIQGEFTIDQTFVFTNCTVKMEPGSKITVQSPNTFLIDQSTLEACSNMWQGIFIENGATCVSTVSSVNDAQYAFDAVDGATIGLYSSTFDRNYVTFHVPNNPNPPYYSIVYHVIDNCIFDCASNLHAAFTGQTPSPGAKSFAGVQADDVNLDFSGLGVNQNHFQNLSNGIVGSRCSFYAMNCDFNLIQRDPAYNSNIYNGSGIYLRGGHGFFYLNQAGYGLNGPPSFNRCYRGIYTEGVNVRSTDNRMTDMDLGYRVDYGSYFNIDILNNYIRSNYYGVDLRMNDNARHLLVEGNQIHFGLIGQGSKGISAINVMEQNGVNIDSKINSNYIWHVPGASNAVNGINMTTASSYQVTNNDVHLINNLQNLKGITTQSCMNDEVSCNTITGPGTNYDLALKDQSAIKVDMGDYHRVSCNHVDGTRNGVYFSGYSYNTDVKGNSINYHKYGLHLDNFSIVGTQKWKGNKWYNTPSTGGLGAWYENLVNANNYKFIYDNVNSPGAIAEPPSWDPAYWFNFLPGQNFECNSAAGFNYCSQFNFVPCQGCDKDLDLDIAQNIIENGDFTDPSQYELAKSLWKLLDTNPAYRDSFPVLDSFYVANQNGFFDLVNEVAATASDLHDIAPGVKQALENNKMQLEVLVQSLKSNVAVLLDDNSTASQKTAASAAITGIKSNILSLTDYDKTAIDLAMSSKTLSADNINIVNTSLAADETYETNEKDVNTIYLATIAKGITTFDAAQTAALLNIAQQCPLAGGNAVYRARSMYSLIDDDAEYDDPATCLNAGIILRNAALNNNAGSKTIGEIPVSIRPNPAVDKATLTYAMPDENNGMLLLTDIFGKEVFRSVLESKATEFTFSTDKFIPSMYFYRVFANDKLIGSGKFSIVK